MPADQTPRPFGTPPLRSGCLSQQADRLQNLRPLQAHPALTTTDGPRLPGMHAMHADDSSGVAAQAVAEFEVSSANCVHAVQVVQAKQKGA